MTKIISLPKELKEFDALLKERIENSSKSKRCLTIMRCIPEINQQIWDEIHTNYQENEWFAVEVDLDKAKDNKLFNAIYEKAKDYNAVKAINYSQCLVQANEKHFLYFGKEQDLPQQ